MLISSRVAWTYETGDDTAYTFSPIVIDNIAYFAAKQGALVAVDAATGKELWVHRSLLRRWWRWALRRHFRTARRELLGKQRPL